MVLAEISLAIGAVKTLSEAIDGAKSLNQIASQLDKCFSLTNDIPLEKPKGKTEKHIQQKLDQYDNTSEESTDLGAITQEILDKKALRNELFRIKTKIDIKWGPGTWDTIIKTKVERLEKQKRIRYEKQRQLQEEKKARKLFYIEIGKGLLLVIAVSGFLYWLLQYY